LLALRCVLNAYKAFNLSSDWQAVQRSRGQLSVKPPRPPLRQRPPVPSALYDNMAPAFPFPAMPPSADDDDQEEWISARPSGQWIVAGQPESPGAESYWRWEAARRQGLVGTSSSKWLKQSPHHHHAGTDERMSPRGTGHDLSVCIGLTVQYSPATPAVRTLIFILTKRKQEPSCR